MAATVVRAGKMPPSMKVPPKRKGNFLTPHIGLQHVPPLNESPSEKEGKSRSNQPLSLHLNPSMKVPPKRKGNAKTQRQHTRQDRPQ